MNHGNKNNREGLGRNCFARLHGGSDSELGQGEANPSPRGGNAPDGRSSQSHFLVPSGAAGRGVPVGGRVRAWSLEEGSRLSRKGASSRQHFTRSGGDDGISPRRGPVRLIVKSRRVPVALTEIEFPQTTSYGVVSTIKKRSVVYDYVLDEGERRIVEEVRQAAENSGLPLEVVDLGRAGPFSRIVSRLLRRLPGGPGPLPSHNQIRVTSTRPPPENQLHLSRPRVEGRKLVLLPAQVRSPDTD